MVAKGKFVDQVRQVMIGLALEATPIAIDAFLKISNGLLSLSLFETFIADEEVGTTSLVIVLFHH